MQPAGIAGSARVEVSWPVEILPPKVPGIDLASSSPLTRQLAFDGSIFPCQLWADLLSLPFEAPGRGQSSDFNEIFYLEEHFSSPWFF